MDLLCNSSSNGELPQSYLNAAPKNKRHMIHKKKIIATNPGVNMEELVNRADIPPDIKRALQDLELEEIEEPIEEPDEQQLQVLEDIWLKAGEMGKIFYICILINVIDVAFFYRFEILFILDVDEASVYDDGYNRKKSKKKKRKQSGGREKKLKIESKSKKEANKVINIQTVDVVKVEIKSEVEDISTFEDISQENSDDLPTIQGNYNDNIIIENDPVEDPLKIDFPEVVDKSTKRRKKHLSHSGQKKIRLKPPTSKSKSRHNNLPFYTDTSTIDGSNANMHRNVMLPNFHGIYTTEKDNNQGKINILPESIISLDNELNMTNVKDETIINITNSDQTDYYSDDNDTEILMDSIMEDRAASIDSLKDDPYKMHAMNRNFDTKEVMAQTNFGYQNESTKIVTHMKQPTLAIYKTAAMPAESHRSLQNSTIKNKDLIKAPRLSVPSDLSVRVAQPAANQKSSRTMGMNISNITILPESAVPSEDIASLYPNTTFHRNPPVLENEVEAGHIRNDNTPKSIPPQLDISVHLPVHLPIGTAITPISNTNGPVLHNNLFSKCDQHGMNSTVNPLGKLSSIYSSKDYAKKFWANFSQFSNYSGLPKPQASAGAMVSKGGYNHIPKFSMPSFSMLKANSIFMPQHSPAMYTSPQIVPAPAYVQNANTSTANVNSTTAAVPNNSKRTTAKNTSRQKSQKGHTSRKKSSSKSDKSNNNAVMNTSRTNITSTSIGTQVNHPIDESFLTFNLPNTDNILSRIANTQGDTICPSVHSLIEKKPAVDDVTQPSESEGISSIFDNKAQLQGLIKTADNTHPHLSPSNVKRSQISILRKKPKEKLKKSTTRKKQTATIATSTSQVTGDETGAMSTQSADVSQSIGGSQPITSMIPGHISEMIYPNVPNSDLLRAFNNYWSAQVSHCAICATFASCTSGSSRVMPPDWRYCQSTTLPESTPIWVREKKNV